MFFLCFQLILYAGGDTAGQQDSTKATFEQRFPNITIDIIVDYSKYHGSRIEYQLSVEQLVSTWAGMNKIE